MTQAGGDWLLLICAGLTLACFGYIFVVALAEYRATDPFGEPYGDVPARPADLKTSFHNVGDTM